MDALFSPSITYAGVHTAVAVLVLMVIIHLWLMGVDLERFIQHLLGACTTCALSLTLAFADVAVLKAEAELAPGKHITAAPVVSATTVGVCWALLGATLAMVAICAVRREELRAACYAFAAPVALGLTARAMQLHTLEDGWGRIHNLAYGLSGFALCIPLAIVALRFWQAKTLRLYAVLDG